MADIDIDKLIDEFDLNEEVEYDFDDTEVEVSLAEKFGEVYDRYQPLFGDTFDRYLIMKGDDETIEKAIAAMEDAIANKSKPVTSDDLGLPEAEAPKDEWDTPDLL